MTSTDTQGISDEQIMEATREFAAEGGRWPSDWIAACRAVLALQPEAAMEEMRTAKQMSAEYLQGFEDGASHIPPPECDQAFEEKYKTSSRDPSNEGDLAKFRDGWNAAQQELPRSYCGSTFDTRPFGAGATVRLHFSDSEEAEKWWISITGRLKERK